MCQDFAGVANQRREQFVFQRREVNFGLTHKDAARGEIDVQIALSERRRFRFPRHSRGMTQRNSDASQ